MNIRWVIKIINTFYVKYINKLKIQLNISLAFFLNKVKKKLMVFLKIY